MPEALAHAVAEGDKGFIQESSGVMLLPFIYMGAKHMMTGYDHLLFLFGVVFFLYRMKDVGLYVTLFAVGHSVTLLLGVLTEISISSYVIDAIIGFSVVYKALDNLGAFQRWFGFQPNTKVATLVFGLLHGFGLAITSSIIWPNTRLATNSTSTHALFEAIAPQSLTEASAAVLASLVAVKQNLLRPTTLLIGHIQSLDSQVSVRLR